MLQEDATKRPSELHMLLAQLHVPPGTDVNTPTPKNHRISINAPKTHRRKTQPPTNTFFVTPLSLWLLVSHLEGVVLLCCRPTVFITRKCSQQIPQETDVSAPIPKTHRIIPDALSTTHQPQPAANQHFSFRVTVHQATLQAAILEGSLFQDKACLARIATASCSQHSMQCHVSRQCLHIKSNKSISSCHLATAITNYY